MRKCTLSLTLALAFFALPLLLSAQTDSTRYAIGAVSLNKDLTQAITIRGEDLEKMPFMNLSDALGAWLLGVYAQPGALVYVVDGNPVTDVNLYPIYDIAEVTWLPNAVATAPYGNGLQELVLITTKRGKGNNGLRFSAQTGLIKGGQFDGPTHTGFYHQYYLGVRRDTGKLSYGFSADWQQDEIASSQTASLSQYTPPTLKRWRLNGRVEWRPNAQNAVRLTLGYAPQDVGYIVNSGGGGYQFHYSDWWYNHLLVPALSWEWRSHGLHNKFDAEYLYSWSRLRYDETDTVDNSGTTVLESGYTQGTGKNSHLVLRDRLSYEAKAGNWKVVPAVDISYQHIDERSDYKEFNPYNPTATNLTSNVEFKGSLFYITPSVDMSLARVLDIAAGVMVNASNKVASGNRRLFPFITAGLDLLHTGSGSGGSSLKLFGSYARRPLLYVNEYSLNDLSSTGKYYGNYSLQQLYWTMSGYTFYNGTGVTYVPFAEDEPGYWAWVTGAAYKSADGRVSLQYSLERRNFSLTVPTNSGSPGFEPWVETLQNADMRIRVIESKKASWMTGFNVSLMHNNGDTAGYQQATVGGPIGDLNGQGNSWTGGWVNRLRFGAFSAGLDLLYHFGETVPVFSFSGTPIGEARKNSVLLPNIYAGYRWSLGAGVLELFVGGRGLLGTRDSDLPDTRRFYTIGGSYSL